MNRLDLEEALTDLLGDGFSIEEDDQGQLIIFTALTQSEDEDELVEFLSDDEPKEHLEVDPDLETLDGLDDEE